MKVRYSETALREPDEIFAYIYERKAFDHKTIIAPLPTRGAVDRPIERDRPKGRIA